jgi:hypothetical protein
MYEHWEKQKYDPVKRKARHLAEKKKCLDCATLVTKTSLRCMKCNGVVVGGRMKGKSLPQKWADNIRKSHPKGKNHPMWKGGVTSESQRLRRGKLFKEWRKAVFERDNYTCQMCSVRGGELHPDHIKPFSLYPEFRFDTNNGRTLCAPCHRSTPTWGHGANNLTREQYEELYA